MLKLYVYINLVGMAVLTKDEIIKLIKEKKIVIKPFNETQVGPGSIDLHLGNEFRIFKKIHDVVDIEDETDYKNVTETIKLEKNQKILIMPGEMMNGITEEFISLPANISGRIEGRSRFARLGLLVHISSGFMQPGGKGRIVLEIANLSPIPLRLSPGVKICQVIFEETKGESIYNGKFSRQMKP